MHAVLYSSYIKKSISGFLLEKDLANFEKVLEVEKIYAQVRVNLFSCSFPKSLPLREIRASIEEVEKTHSVSRGVSLLLKDLNQDQRRKLLKRILLMKPSVCFRDYTAYCILENLEEPEKSKSALSLIENLLQKGSKKHQLESVVQKMKETELQTWAIERIIRACIKSRKYTEGESFLPLIQNEKKRESLQLTICDAQMDEDIVEKMSCL